MDNHAFTILRTLAQLEPPVERKALYTKLWLTQRTISNHLAELECRELIRIRRWGPIHLTMKGQTMVDQLELLRIIADNQPILRINLARRLGISSEQIHYTIRQLEDDGLVRLSANRRVVWLTARGAELINE